MKLNYCFGVVTILIILVSLTAVVAGENVSDDASLSENTLNSEEACDLSVKVDVEKVMVENRYNVVGCEVPWNVTAKVSGGIAHNAKVKISLNGNFEYASHDTDDGVFDSKTLIWDIGDLDSSKSAFLSIITKIKVNGTFRLTASATCDSDDIDLSNNEVTVPTKSGVSKFGSNVTETSNDKSSVSHSDHYASSGKGGVSQRISHDGKSSSGNSNGKSSDSNSQSASKSILNGENSVLNVVDSYFNFGANPLNSQNGISNSTSADDSDKKINPFRKQVAPFLSAQDYKSTPIGIFALFLVVLLAIVGYDKIKS